MTDPKTRAHPNDPLHGITLKALLEELLAHYGWEGLGRLIEIRCFTHDPSMGSSLKFLRREQWARLRVEELFLELKKGAVTDEAVTDAAVTDDADLDEDEGPPTPQA